MSSVLRRAVGVIAIGLLWAAGFGAAFVALIGLALLFRPQDVGPGEGAAVALVTGARVGLASGALFGLVLTALERGRTLSAVPWPRAAACGALAAVPWPLLTQAHDSMLVLLCPLGVGCALLTRALARRPGGVGRLLASAGSGG